MDTPAPTRTGLLLGVGAYALWGLLPFYLKLLAGVGAGEVLAHRILWSLVLLAGIVVATGRVRAIRAAARGRTLALLCASAVLIAINWIVYIWAVLHGHVLEGSLGYFINPLVAVVLGVVVLGERIRPVQVAAVGIACVGVGVLVVASVTGQGGGAWWIPVTLALSFSTYGLVRKVVAIDALGGLVVETVLLAPPALAWLAYVEVQGIAGFGRNVRLDLLLICAGAVTAAPLLMFTAAARRLPYTTVGLLQYILPTIVFLEAVLLFGEHVDTARIVTFALIWAGCALYATDSLRAAARDRSGA